MSVSLKINEQLNGIELYFTSKPSEEVRSMLKSNSFRWSGSKFCWYAKQSEKAFKVANSLTNNEVIEEVKEVKEPAKKAASKKVMPLWESTQWEEIELTQKQKDQENKLIAKEIKAHVKTRFPQVKFSVSSKGWNSVNLYIVSSPFEKESVYLSAIRDYCKNLINAYKYCTCYDPYGDYGSSYNFYGYAEIHWQYEQTEVTEEVKKDMVNFDIKAEEAEKAAEEKRHQEFLAWQAQRELDAIEYEKRHEEEKKQIENIYNSVEVKEIEENNQYFITGAEFADLNKNNTLDQYKEEVLKGEYELQDVKITKEVHFNNAEALENFSNMLLVDFSFLENTGGSFTDDERINSMTDFYNMDERESVKWNLYGVAIYFEGKLQFVVDAQGYSYARYVGLTDNATIEKTVEVQPTIDNEELNELKKNADMLEDISSSVINELNILDTWQGESWNEYKEGLKNKLKNYNFKLTKEIIQQLEIDSLKVAMYKVLSEVDGIQEQFKEAEIQKGEKVTMFYISDFGSIVTNRITFDSVENKPYAQYENAVKVTFTPERKRQLHYKYFHGTLLVFKGWHSLPESVLHETFTQGNGYTITKSKYHSCDHKQYDEIINYFGQQELRPVINTYKPIF